MENNDEEISFGAIESFEDSRTISAESISLGPVEMTHGKVVLDFEHVDDLCNQRKLGVCTMCGVRMAVEHHFADGIRLDEYWGYLMGKTLYDDPLFGHFEGSSALTMLKTATNYGIPEKDFCKQFPLKTDGTYGQFFQSFIVTYGGNIPPAILENAKKHKIPGYYRIFGDELSGKSPSPSGVAAQIAAGRVIVARFAIGNNLHKDVDGNSSRKAVDLLPLRKPDPITGGHIMDLNEFWLNPESFDYDFGGPNSWSRTWCPDNTKQEAGYFWFESDTQKGYWTEAWAIMKGSDKYNFTKDLTLGSTGPDVVALQKYLVGNFTHGYNFLTSSLISLIINSASSLPSSEVIFFFSSGEATFHRANASASKILKVVCSL